MTQNSTLIKAKKLIEFVQIGEFKMPLNIVDIDSRNASYREY
jgi:hypothetical protein